MQIVSRERDVDARGRGTEEFVKAALPDGDDGYGPLCWLDQIDGCAIVADAWHPLGIRAAERRCSTTVDVTLPDGTLLVRIVRAIPSGGRANLTGGIVRAGALLWGEAAGIESCQSVRAGSAWTTRITFADGHSIVMQHTASAWRMLRSWWRRGAGW